MDRPRSSTHTNVSRSKAFWRCGCFEAKRAMRRVRRLGRLRMSEVVLGLNAYHGDSSAALLVDGLLEMAVEEERFNRFKHWAGLPVAAAKACVARTGGAKLSHIAISRDPKA